MARVSFITLYDKGCLGTRYLSSFLKRAGHSADIIYLGRHEGRVMDKKETAKSCDDLWIGINEYGAELVRSYSDPIQDKEIALLIDLLVRRKPDIVAFSLRTMFLNTARRITESIRSRLKVPVIYGVIAPTCQPERCIQYADMICLGEGELSMLKLVEALDNGRDLQDVGNIWFKQGQDIYRNPVLPLEQDLDSLPFPDYAAENKFAIRDCRLIENDPAIGNMSRFTYEVMTSRGCPFACSYCCNDLLRSLYPKQSFLRRRSVANVIDELKAAKERHNIRSVLFRDEVFTFDLDWIKEFSARYKREVNLPFWCNTHPSLVNEEILKILKSDGMFSITMGIQSGSENVLFNVFNRRTPGEKIINAAKILKKLDLPDNPRFDMITDNPFETEDDCRQTLELLMRLPKPVNFGLTKLSFIPGTKIAKVPLEQAPGWNMSVKARLFWNLLYLLNQYMFFPNALIIFLSKRSFLKHNPYLLYVFLLPKFLEIKFQELSGKIKKGLPPGVVLVLKRVRYRLKGY